MTHERWPVDSLPSASRHGALMDGVPWKSVTSLREPTNVFRSVTYKMCKKGAAWERLAHQYWTQVERCSSIDLPAAQRRAVQGNHRPESPTREHRNRVFASFAHKPWVPHLCRPCQTREAPWSGHSHSIVSATCNYLKYLGFLAGHPGLTVRNTVEKSRLRAIDGNRCRKQLP
jgi:hypothetical protein